MVRGGQRLLVSHAVQPGNATALIFRAKIKTRNDENCRSLSFPEGVARMQRAAGKQLVVRFPR
jgi:hypothetical protein